MTLQSKQLLLAAGCVLLLSSGAEAGRGRGRAEDHGALANKTDETTREGKFLSMFKVVKFKNEACNATNEKGGTCYTSQECMDRGGSPLGTCAESYGVCCVFSLGCGSMTSENCTYFDVMDPQPGSCTLQVCASTDICQLRLDFDQFVIAGPSTSTVHTVDASLAMDMPDGDQSHTQMTQCMTDTFTVSQDSARGRPPTLCGINNGEHMYVDKDSSCNKLAFQIHQVGVSAGIPSNRGWSIKVSQYSCDYNNLAPDSCTQYFWGSGNGVIRTFNYAGGIHLASQRQKFCVRQERNICKVCWTPTAAIDFQVSDTDTNDGTQGSYCCGYGPYGTDSTGNDCISIPGHLETFNKILTVDDNHFCGRRFDPGSDGGDSSQTVCQVNQAFEVTFLSDPFEEEDEAEIETGNKGLQFAYIQVPC